VSGDALDDYVEQLEGEVRKYLGHPNYGKVAKRMYNVFRYSGRHVEAAYVRELFDEPTVILYQVWSLLWTLENAAVAGSTLPEENVRAQADELVMTVVQALDGVQEEQVVAALLRLRSALEANRDENDEEAVERELDAAKSQLENVINTFFRDRLEALPTIKDYLDSLGVVPGSGGHWTARPRRIATTGHAAGRVTVVSSFAERADVARSRCPRSPHPTREGHPS
jgi:hypothetical protein